MSISPTARRENFLAGIARALARPSSWSVARARMPPRRRPLRSVHPEPRLGSPHTPLRIIDHSACSSCPRAAPFSPIAGLFKKGGLRYHPLAMPRPPRWPDGSHDERGHLTSRGAKYLYHRRAGLASWNSNPDARAASLARARAISAVVRRARKAAGLRRDGSRRVLIVTQCKGCMDGAKRLVAALKAAEREIASLYAKLREFETRPK
jgi:hypothetical protein